MPKKQKRSKRRSHDDDSEIDELMPNEDDTGDGGQRDEMDVEEREIRRLEKLLGLNKRWKRRKKSGDERVSQKLPASFQDMGLDYLLKPILKSEFLAKKSAEAAEPPNSKRKVKESNTEQKSNKKQSLYTEEAESSENDSANEAGPSKSRKLSKPQNLSDDVQRLQRRAMALMNRLSEPTVPPLYNEARQLYSSGSFPRASISNALCDAALTACVEKPNFVVPDKVIAPVAMFFALLRANNVASEAVGQLIHRLAWKVVELSQADEDMASVLREKSLVENAIRLLSHLHIFRCLDSVLLLDILSFLSDQIVQNDCDYFDSDKAEYAANMVISLFRSAGRSLRKNDPSGLGNALREVQEAASGARSRTEVTPGSRLHFLADVIAAVRNNNFGKIPGYDAEESSKFSKQYTRLKADLGTHDSAVDSPFRVSLSALSSYGESGSNWWLKADTCSGPMAVEAASMTGKRKKGQENELQKPAENNQHAQLAQKLHLSTDVRKSLFSVIVSSSDIDDAVERVFKLPLRSEIQRTEAIPVAFECCVRERNYNPFYSQLLARLCAQESDRKQRLFRLAVKKSFTERLAIPTTSSTVVANLAKMCVDLIKYNAISFVTALRCIDFTSAAPGSPTYAFLHGLLDMFFGPSKLEEGAFRRLVVVPLLSAKAQAANGRRIGSSLLLFAKHMYDSGETVSVDTEDGEKQRKIKGVGKYKIEDLRPRLDMLASEMM